MFLFKVMQIQHPFYVPSQCLIVTCSQIEALVSNIVEEISASVLKFNVLCKSYQKVSIKSIETISRGGMQKK